MPTVRELEDLIIDAIYLDMLRGKLDQKEGQFEVEYTMGRDLEPGKIESVLASLKDWAATTSAVLATLDKKIADVSKSAASNKKMTERHEQQVQAVLKEVKDKESNSSAGKSGLGGMMMNTRKALERGDRMDVDYEPSEGKGKNRK